MKKLIQIKINKWVQQSLMFNPNYVFINSIDLYKDFCATYNIPFDLNNLKSFGMHFSKVIKYLNWNIKKGRHNKLNGYFHLSFTHQIDTQALINKKQTIENINTDLYLNVLSEISNKLNNQEIILKALTGKDFDSEQFYKKLRENSFNNQPLILNNNKLVYETITIEQPKEVNIINQPNEVTIEFVKEWLVNYCQHNPLAKTPIHLLIKNYCDIYFPNIEPTHIFNRSFIQAIRKEGELLWPGSNLHKEDKIKKANTAYIVGLELKI